MIAHGWSYDELRSVLDRDATNREKWQMTDYVEMRFNRLVVYNGEHFHSHILDFAKAQTPAARLTLTCWGRSAD
jgi:hypothetical protein